MKAKGNIGITDAMANERPVRKAALIGGQDSSEVNPISSPKVYVSFNSISEATLSAIASASIDRN